MTESLIILTLGKSLHAPSKEFFFFTCLHKKREGARIRTSDLRFMKHGPQPIELPLEDICQTTIQLIMSPLNF